jgi:hypothetical protein
VGTKTTDPLRAVFGLASDDVWAVAANPSYLWYDTPILHWNGSTWSVMESTMAFDLMALWTTDTDAGPRVWTAGYLGAILVHAP